MTWQSYGVLAINHGSQPAALTVGGGWESPKQSHKCLWGLKLAVAVISVKGGVERTLLHQISKTLFPETTLTNGEQEEEDT